MKTKNTIFALLALLIVGIVAAAGASAMGWMQGNNEDRDEIRQAIEDNDFDSWKTLHQERLTEENFNEIVERHESRELCRESHEAVRDAIDNEDYEAYLEAVSSYDDCPYEMPELTEDDFNILTQIHDAREEGNFDLAHELMEDLDVDMPFGNGQGMMRQGMNQMQKGMRNIGQGMRMQNMQRN